MPIDLQYLPPEKVRNYMPLAGRLKALTNIRHLLLLSFNQIHAREPNFTHGTQAQTHMHSGTLTNSTRPDPRGGRRHPQVVVGGNDPGSFCDSSGPHDVG